jgi:urea carboxylase-associated protein 2
MTTLDRLGPEEHRARYEALRRAASERARAAAAEPSPQAVVEASVLHREIVPAGWYWSAPIAAGRRLRIVNRSGRTSVSLQLWHALDSSERFNAGDTVKLQWNALLLRERLLFSDMGRVLAAVVDEQAGGRHDMLTGGSTPASNARRYGGQELRNTRDNFRAAALKLGLSRRDVHPCVTLFAGVRVDAEGRFVWHGEGTPGEYVELRAELPLLVALSNCPHPLDPRPEYDPGDAEALVIEAQAVAPDDGCRTASVEAERGYDNTDDWLLLNGSRA